MPLTPSQARARVLDGVEPLTTEAVPLGEAIGRTLSQAIHADRDLPPADRSAMDGYACRAEETDGRALRVDGVIAAGEPLAGPLSPGTAMRCFTGGLIPDGADCVAMQEVCLREGVEVRVRVAQGAGENILCRGEDALSGALLLSPGDPLTPGRLGVLAMVGAETVQVVRRPTVAVLTTGSELQAVGATVAAHQLRNSNGPAVVGMLECLTPARVHLEAPIADDLEALVARLAALLDSFDVVITTGGASVGDRDHLGEAARLVGLTTHFDRLLMKPGKPVTFATDGPRRLLGLPGSPLAALTACRVLAVPLLRTLGGATAPVDAPRHAVLTATITNKPGRTRMALVTLASEPTSGVLLATPVVTHSVADLVAAGRADGMVEIGPEHGDVPAGTVLPFWSWGEMR